MASTQPHPRGKLVVIAIITLGIALGLVGLLYRPIKIVKPTTQPSQLHR